MFPVVAELRRRGESPTIIATGQHTDLLRGTPFDDGMAPNVNLGLAGSNDPFGYAAICEGALRAKWVRDKPELVIVQGDTASAYAGALAALNLKIPMAHIEAGIRSGDPDDPFPEEAFRIWIDDHATSWCCATASNWRNLEAQLGKDEIWATGKTLITGNPGIDALYSHTKPVEQSQKGNWVLITLHRRESFGEPLQAIVSGLVAAAERYPDIEFCWPVHPNPKVQEALPAVKPDNLGIGPPMSTVFFAQMLSKAQAVISDSGGVQEEAAALGIPCVVAREKTDRPESVELGMAEVVGRTERGILDGLQWALGSRLWPSECFGDGHASPRIVDHLLG